MEANASRKRFPESANGYRKCIKKHCKTKQNQCFCGRKRLRSLAVCWGHTRGICESQRGILVKRCENKGFRVCACMISIVPMAHANGLQNLQTVIGNPWENVVKQRKTSKNGKAGKVSISWKTMVSLLGTVAHHFTEECSMQCGNLKLSCTHVVIQSRLRISVHLKRINEDIPGILMDNIFSLQGI